MKEWEQERLADRKRYSIQDIFHKYEGVLRTATAELETGALFGAFETYCRVLGDFVDLLKGAPGDYPEKEQIEASFRDHVMKAENVRAEMDFRYHTDMPCSAKEELHTDLPSGRVLVFVCLST